MIAHDLSPRLRDTSQLSAYMDREWMASTAYLRDGNGGEGPVQDARRPTGLLARFVRSTRTMVRSALL